MMKRLLGLLALLLLFAPMRSGAQSVTPGLYHATQGPELAAQLEIRADGHFAYALSYGALDEQAEGIWAATEKGVALTTRPRPKPPEFRLDHQGSEGDAPFHIVVRWPDGRGLAGVDFRMGFANGTVLDGYTQADGWTLGESALGMPLWIELIEPMHGFTSPRFPISADTHSMAVTLAPNDMGIAAFENMLFESTGDGDYLFHHPMGNIRFRLAKP